MTKSQLAEAAGVSEILNENVKKQKKWLVKCAKRQASHLAVYIAV